MSKEAPVNTIKLNIDRAEEMFAGEIMAIIGCTKDEANRVSILLRRRDLARLNDRANKIVPKNKGVMAENTLRAALKMSQVIDARIGDR